MSGEELPKSSAIDTTGDLSRSRIDPRHVADVGAPLAAAPYKPNKVRHNFGNEEGSSFKATECALVLGTLDTNGRTEYRVGSFPNEDVLKRGLCDQDGVGVRLKPQATQRCFAGSQTYYDRSEAIRAAEATYPKHCGIKVMKFPCKFPV